MTKTLVLCAFSLLLATQASARSPEHRWTEKRRSEMARSVRAEFLHAWSNYRKYAWGHDEVRPLSHEAQDWYGTSLMMTPVDALDTLILMGFDKEAKDTRELIATKLDFDKDVSVKGFEISIRLLGGLLSSYQLTGDKRLLRLADDLGTRLLPIFDNPTGLPYVNVNLKTGAVEGTGTNPAEIGSYLLEFGTLSKLTGKPIYYQKAKHAVLALYDRRSKLNLFGTTMDAATGQWTNHDTQVGAMLDSFFEYLIKCAKLFGDKDCERMWRTTIDALNKYSAEDAPSGFWYGEANIDTGARTGHIYGALNAFFPAILVLDGQMDRARKLQASGFKMWNLHGIEPELLDYEKMQVVSPGYVLRPEIVESTYYLYSKTREDQYEDMGAKMFGDLVRYCRVDGGYASLGSVVTKEKVDNMESFFFAETMKYYYLLFAPHKTLDLDKVVLNTEAHPFRKTWK